MSEATHWNEPWNVFRAEDEMSDRVHVVPVDDLIGHETDDGQDCVCGPRVEVVERDDGSDGWVVTHYSLDGREVEDDDD